MAVSLSALIRRGSSTYAVMPTARRRSLVVDAQADLERLDVALGAADVALRREAGVDAAIEHGALALVARRQADRQRVAEPDAIDVGLLDVGAHPQVVGVDQRHDRLARGRRPRPRAPRARRRCRRSARGSRCSARRTSALVLLRGGGRLLLLARLHLAAAHRRSARRSTRASATAARCASTCLLERVDACACAASNAVRAWSSSCADATPSARQILRAREGQPRVLEVGGRRRLLRLGRRERRLGLADLVGRSAAPGSAAPPRASLHLRRQALRRSARSRRCRRAARRARSPRAAGPS